MKYAPIHGYYWVLPILTAVMWFTDLVTLLGLWAKDHHKIYEKKEPDPVFVSDVGAAHHKVFMGLSITTAILYMLTILAERYLRHQRRIPGSIKRISTYYDWGCVFFTWLGCCALIALSVLDCFHHSTAHWTCAVIFIVGILVGVIFQCLEIYSLCYSHRGTSQKVFKNLFWIATLKVVILLIAIGVAIAFACLQVHCHGDASSTVYSNCRAYTNAAAICEWVISFILFLYFFSHILDFWPARDRYSNFDPRATQSSGVYRNLETDPWHPHHQPYDPEMAEW